MDLEKYTVENCKYQPINEKQPTCWDLFKQKIRPESHFDDGTPRLISIDFLRGFSIFFLSLFHDALYFCDIDALLQSKGFTQIALLVALVPIAIFAHWRCFFIIISGIAFSFTGYKKSRSVKRMTIELLAAEMIAAVLLPVCFFLDLMYRLFTNWALQSRDFTISGQRPMLDNAFLLPWYQTLIKPSTPLFFAVIFFVTPLVDYLVKLPIALWSRMSIRKELAAMAITYTALACGIIFSTDAVQYAIYKGLNAKYPGVLEGQYECPVNHIGDYYNNNGLAAAGSIALNLVNGFHTAIFPFLGTFFLGCAIGLFYAIVKETKCRCPPESWSVMRKRFLVFHGFLFLLPLVMCGIQSLITLADINAQRRIRYQNITQIMQLDVWVNCQQPEFLLFDVVLQFITLHLFILLFESRSKEKLIKITNSSLFFRRYSTGSMTVFIFSTLLGNILRFFLPYEPSSVWLQIFMFPVNAILQLGVLIFLDGIDWAGTPDFVMNFLTKKLTGRYKKGNFASKGHLKVKSIMLFEKPQEGNQIPGSQNDAAEAQLVNLPIQDSDPSMAQLKL